MQETHKQSGNSFDWELFQNDVVGWVRDCIPQSNIESQVLGMFEEIGELAHSIRCLKDGIRGSEEKHLEDIADAIGDTVIYSMNLMEGLSICATDIIKGIIPLIVNVNGVPREFLQQGCFDHTKIDSIINSDFDGVDYVTWIASASANLGVVWSCVLEEETTCTNSSLSMLFVALNTIACGHNLSFIDCVLSAWDRTRIRDWVKYPKNGLSER